VIARLRPERLELQLKIAADSAWPLVQEISPGAIFTMEDFESVGRPLLLAAAKTMEELTVDGKITPPVHLEVRVVEDTFLLAFTYAVPARGTVQLKENYLAKMSPEYASHLRLYDAAGTLWDSKSLTGVDRTFAFILPLFKPAGSGPPAPAANSPAAVPNR
jgi:hypothetical protein